MLTLWQALCKPFTCVNLFNPQYCGYYYPPILHMGRLKPIISTTVQVSTDRKWGSRRPRWSSSQTLALRCSAALPRGITLRRNASGFLCSGGFWYLLSDRLSSATGKISKEWARLGPCSNGGYILIWRGRKYTSKQTREFQQVLSPMKKKPEKWGKRMASICVCWGGCCYFR